MILLIDNYDSFVHNLARYIAELGEEPVVRRNDEATIADIEALHPSHIVISPGPCTPAEAGISIDVIRHFAPTTPILGVCLGHQAIGAAFGGRIVRASRPVHGKTSRVAHDRRGLFDGLPTPIRATRYHSLVIERASLPDALVVTAEAEDDREIMGVAHRQHPVYGVQFHPESVLSEHGYAIIENFLRPGGRQLTAVGVAPDALSGARGVKRTPSSSPEVRPG